jgi:hypothetical protein
LLQLLQLLLQLLLLLPLMMLLSFRTAGSLRRGNPFLVRDFADLDLNF